MNRSFLKPGTWKGIQEPDFKFDTNSHWAKYWLWQCCTHLHLESFRLRVNQWLGILTSLANLWHWWKVDCTHQCGNFQRHKLANVQWHQIGQNLEDLAHQPWSSSAFAGFEWTWLCWHRRLLFTGKVTIFFTNYQWNFMHRHSLFNPFGFRHMYFQ